MPKRLSAKRISGSSQALTAQELARRNDVSVEQMTGAIRMGSRDELKAQGGSVVGITKKVTGARLSARRQALSHLKSDPTYYKRLRREKEQQAKKGSQMNLVKNPSQTPPSPATEPKVIKNGDSSDSIAARHAAIIEGIFGKEKTDSKIAREWRPADDLKADRNWTRPHTNSQGGVERQVDGHKGVYLHTEHTPTKHTVAFRAYGTTRWDKIAGPHMSTVHATKTAAINTAHAHNERNAPKSDSVTSEIDTYLSERATDHPMQPKHWNTFAGGTGAKNPNHHSYSHNTEHGEYHIWPPQGGPGRPRGWSLMFAHTRGGKSDGKPHPNVPHSGLWHGLGHHKTAHAAMKAARDHHASAKLPTNDSTESPGEGRVDEIDYKKHLHALDRHYTRLGDGRNVDARKATNINTPHMRPGILSPKKSAQVSRVSRKLSWKSMSPEEKKIAHSMLGIKMAHAQARTRPADDSITSEIDAYLAEFVTSGAVGGFVGTTLGGTKLASADLPDEVSKRLITLRKPSRPRPALSTTPWEMQGFDGKGS
jgi:hypothetical protein